MIGAGIAVVVQQRDAGRRIGLDGVDIEGHDTGPGDVAGLVAGLDIDSVPAVRQRLGGDVEGAGGVGDGRADQHARFKQLDFGAGGGAAGEGRGGVFGQRIVIEFPGIGAQHRDR